MGLEPDRVARPTAAGVDIGIARYDLAIVDTIRIAEQTVLPRLVFYGKLRDEQEATWVCRQYGVKAIIADSMPDGTLCLRWQKSILGRYGVKHFWRAQYNTMPSQVEIVENSVEGIVKLDKLLTLDSVKYAFETGMGFYIPQNFRELDQGNWVKEMTCCTRNPVIWHGVATYRWEGPPDDHAFHALNYAKVAMEYSGLSKWASASLLGAVKGEVARDIEAEESMSVFDDEDSKYGDLVLEA